MCESVFVNVGVRITSINVHKSFCVHLVGVYMASEKPSNFIGLIYAIIKFNLAP